MSRIPRLPSPNLCPTFEKESEKVWRNLGRALHLRLSQSEETITENLILNIQTSHPREVWTYQFNKREEGTIGADWEWWLTNGSKWIGLLIQAKKLNPVTNKYDKIVYKRQMGDLIQWAGKKGTSPLYVFYNFTTESLSKLAWNCGSTVPTKTQLGCTMAHAAAVKLLVNTGSVDLSTMSKISLPMKCLVCCTVLGDPDASLPGRVNGVVKLLGSLAQGIEPGPGVIEPSQLRDEPPGYVEKLLSTPEEERGALIEQLKDEVGPIDKLIVIKESLNE